MKNLGQMMKQAQQMQSKMAEMQAQLETVEMTGAAGGGLVQVTVGGKGDLRKVKLDKSLLDPNEVEVLEDLIVAAFNEAKTRVCQLPQERFDFLGYTFGRWYSAETGRAYFGTRPSKKSLTRIIGAIRECTAQNMTWQGAEDLVTQINAKLIGWANYFSLGPVSKAYHTIEWYTKLRLRRWLCLKHKVQSSGWKRYPDEYLHEKLGLVRLCLRQRDLPWAKA